MTPDELGSGSFAQVYKGIDKRTNTPVAIKVIDSKLLDSERARFVLLWNYLTFHREYHEREKQIFKSLNHINIVSLYDVVEKDEPQDGKYYFFVMELCEGGGLDAHTKKPLPEELVRKLLMQLKEAFLYLKSKNIVHRDLKPQNILLTSNDLEKATLKLCGTILLFY